MYNKVRLSSEYDCTGQGRSSVSIEIRTRCVLCSKKNKGAAEFESKTYTFASSGSHFMHTRAYCMCLCWSLLCAVLCLACAPLFVVSTRDTNQSTHCRTSIALILADASGRSPRKRVGTASKTKKKKKTRSPAACDQTQALRAQRLLALLYQTYAKSINSMLVFPDCTLGEEYAWTQLENAAK